jgi:hypothetical protein
MSGTRIRCPVEINAVIEGVEEVLVARRLRAVFMNCA